MGTPILVLIEEPEVKLLETHGSKFLSCYVWFEDENMKVCIINDKDIIVFSSFCLAPSLSEADITTKSGNIMDRIRYQMPDSGEIRLYLNRNEKGKKFPKRKDFDENFLIDFKRHMQQKHRNRDYSVEYTLKVI